MRSKMCDNFSILMSLESSYDRLQECAWFIRMMEQHYHQADQLRWSWNSFLRTLKEVVQMITIEVQGNKDVKSWFDSEKKDLHNDGLIKFLFQKRNHMVHTSIFKPSSNGMIGFTRGRGLKLGLGLPIDPLEDSEVAILKYIDHAVSETDFFGILYSEEDGGGEYTCVHREWRLKGYGDAEVTHAAAQAWNKISHILFEVAQRLGAKVVELRFELSAPNDVQLEIYPPEWIKQKIDDARAHIVISKKQSSVDDKAKS